MRNQTQTERVAEEVAANTAEYRFWLESGDYAGIAVRGADGVYGCYSRSDIFIGSARHLLGCRTLILGY